MIRKTVAGLIAIVVISTVVMFTGCVEEEKSLPTPSPAILEDKAEGTRYGATMTPRGDMRYKGTRTTHCSVK